MQMLVTFLERDEIRRIFRLRRQVILFQRIVGPMAEFVGKLANLDLPCIDDHAKPYFRDVLDHVSRVDVRIPVAPCPYRRWHKGTGRKAVRAFPQRRQTARALFPLRSRRATRRYRH